MIDSYASQHQDLDEDCQEIDLNAYSTVEKDCQLELKMQRNSPEIANKGSVSRKKFTHN